MNEFELVERFVAARQRYDAAALRLQEAETAEREAWADYSQLKAVLDSQRRAER